MIAFARRAVPGPPGAGGNLHAAMDDRAVEHDRVAVVGSAARQQAISGSILAQLLRLNSEFANYVPAAYQPPRVRLAPSLLVSEDDMAEIPSLVEAIVSACPEVKFDRAHFAGFGASSLDFEVVFWISNPLFDDSMDALHTVNLAIFKRFGEEGIEFAYPTQTMIVQGGTLVEDKPGA